MGKMKLGLGIFTVLGCLILVAPPTAFPQIQNPMWANILWDTNHGVYIGYAPSNRYSDLVTILGAKGYTLEENSEGILNLDLSNYAVIVISIGSAWDSPYTPEEVTAITNFVTNGGSLLIMTDGVGAIADNIRAISESFGTSLGVSIVANDYISNFSDHAIFAGVSEIYMASTIGIAGVSPSSEEAWSENGSAVVTTAQSGEGHVIVMSDINTIENQYLTDSDNQLFSENVFDWLVLNAIPVIYISQDGFCDGNEPCFSTVQDGVDEVEQFSFLKVSGGGYDEDVMVDQPNGLAFQGGWDATFTTRVSFTTIKSMTIEDGSVTAEYLEIQ